MKTIRILVSFIFVMSALSVNAQESEGFTADRPGATTGPDVLPTGRVQWETGVAWEHSKLYDIKATTWTLNTSMLRWGFSDYAELRLQADLLQTSEEGEHYGGFDNVTIGTKVKLFDGWKAVPAMSLLANLFVPGGSDSNYLPQEWGGQIGLLFQNQLTSRLGLGYEADLIWSDDDRPTVFWGFCLGFDINDRFSVAVEEFNYNTRVGTECWSEISLAYQLSNRLQIDLGTDISLDYPKRYHNLMLGLSWQITK